MAFIYKTIRGRRFEGYSTVVSFLNFRVYDLTELSVKIFDIDEPFANKVWGKVHVIEGGLTDILVFGAIVLFMSDRQLKSWRIPIEKIPQLFQDIFRHRLTNPPKHKIDGTRNVLDLVAAVRFQREEGNE